MIIKTIISTSPWKINGLPVQGHTDGSKGVKSASLCHHSIVICHTVLPVGFKPYNYVFKRFFNWNKIVSLFPSLSSLQPLPATLPKPLPCPSTLSSGEPLFLRLDLLHTYVSVVYVCVYTNIHGHNLLNLVWLVGGVSVSLRLMTLRWTTNQETHLWERSILLLPQSYGTWSSLSRDETHENVPSRLKMSTDVAIVPILFTQPALGENGSQ